MGEDRDIARLGRIWDALGRGHGATGTDADREDVSEIRSLLQLDRQPPPNSMFVARLEEILLRPSPAVGLLPLTELPTPVPLQGAAALDGSASMPWGDEAFAWRRWVVAAATLVLVGVLAATAVFSGGDDPTKPTVLPAYGAASPEDRPWQETAVCDVPPRPAADFAALLAGTPAVIEPSHSLEVVEPRDPKDVIEETVRELTACRNARDVARHYALWTDEAILRADLLSEQKSEQSLLETLIRSMDYTERLDGTPETVTESRFWRVIRVENVAQIPDSRRVRATVWFDVPGGELAMEMIFVGRDGVALLDDAEGWTYESSDDGTPPA